MYIKSFSSKRMKWWYLKYKTFPLCLSWLREHMKENWPWHYDRQDDLSPCFPIQIVLSHTYIFFLSSKFCNLRANQDSWKQSNFNTIIVFVTFKCCFINISSQDFIRYDLYFHFINIHWRYLMGNDSHSIAVKNFTPLLR